MELRIPNEIRKIIISIVVFVSVFPTLLNAQIQSNRILSNRNLITSKTILLEKADPNDKRKWWYRIYIEPEDTPSPKFKNLAIGFEASDGITHVEKIESFANVANFERIEEIGGDQNILLVKTYYQSEGATGIGDHIYYLYVYAFDKEKFKQLKKFTLQSETQPQTYQYYYIIIDGLKTLILESLTERKAFTIDVKGLSLTSNNEITLYKKLLPSYSCTRVNFVERVICEDAGLATLDSLMNSFYKELINNNAIVTSQRRWLRKREECVKYDIHAGLNDCLADMYKQRIFELSESVKTTVSGTSEN